MTRRDPVLVLHGLGRSARSMAPMARALGRAGFEPHLVDYASRAHAIGPLTATVVAERVDALLAGGAARVHFVTHSLGGVLVRADASRRFDAGAPLPDGSRAVFLAPPFTGSEVADRLAAMRLFQAWNGPAMSELGTDEASVPNTLGPIRGIEAGVIAGTRRIVPFDRFFDGPNDGLVSVASATTVPGLADSLVLPVSHALLMRERLVIRQAIRFLTRGRFDPA